MVVLLCGELAVTVYVVLEKSTIEGEIRKQLLYDVENYNNNSNIDFVQTKFECCGADNYTDYQNSDFFKSGDSTSTYVPDSCCPTIDKNPKLLEDRDACQRAANFSQISGQTNGTTIFTKGCFSIIQELIEANSTILIGITAGIVVLEILGIVFAVFLCRNRTDYDFYDD